MGDSSAAKGILHSTFARSRHCQMEQISAYGSIVDWLLYMGVKIVMDPQHVEDCMEGALGISGRTSGGKQAYRYCLAL